MNGLIIGIINVFLWFSPWYSWTQEFMGELTTLTQNGLNVGGMAYLLLAASILYAVFSYQKNYQLQIVFGAVQLAVTLLFLLNGSLSIGLPAIALGSIAGIYLGVTEKKNAQLAMKESSSSEGQ